MAASQKLFGEGSAPRAGALLETCDTALALQVAGDSGRKAGRHGGPRLSCQRAEVPLNEAL